MSKYKPRIVSVDTKSVLAKADTMTSYDVIALVAGMDAKCLTRDEMIAWIESVERDEVPLGSWHMPYSFDEFARRVRAGEDI